MEGLCRGRGPLMTYFPMIMGGTSDKSVQQHSISETRWGLVCLQSDVLYDLYASYKTSDCKLHTIKISFFICERRGLDCYIVAYIGQFSFGIDGRPLLNPQMFQ